MNYKKLEQNSPIELEIEKEKHLIINDDLEIKIQSTRREVEKDFYTTDYKISILESPNYNQNIDINFINYDEFFNDKESED